MIAVLCGGVGAAKFLEGARMAFGGEEIVAVVNVGDDEIMHGLHISPDIDTVLYTLAGLVNTATGWGIADETWRVMQRLESLGGPTWFRLGDLDLATHLYRSGRLAAGATLSEVTTELAESLGIDVKVVPVSDEPMRTHITVVNADKSQETIGFQEYFVKRHHDCDVVAVNYHSPDDATLTLAARYALRDARAIVIAPSNPILSIAPMMSIGELSEVLEARRARTFAISPIVAGNAIKGPADRLLASLGFGASALGVAAFYAGFARNIIIDDLDAELAPEIEKMGFSVSHCNTIMDSLQAKEALGNFLRHLIDA